MMFLTGSEPGLPGLRGPMGRRVREAGGERARWTSMVGLRAHGHSGQRDGLRRGLEGHGGAEENSEIVLQPGAL